MDIFYLWSIVAQHNEDVSYSLNTSSHLASNMGLIGQTSHLQRQNNKVVVSFCLRSRPVDCNVARPCVSSLC